MSFFKMIQALFTTAPRLSPAEAAPRVRSGAALLVDVREPSEWSSGVAESAALLPMSDLNRDRRLWRDFLAQVGEREVLVYCAMGGRSAIVARMLVREGIRAADTGGLRGWAASGWPVVPAPGATSKTAR